MFCSNCGCKLSDGAKFCPECGTKTNIQQENQTATNPVITEEKIVSSNGQSNDLLSEQTAVELINYIQFSVAKIVNGKSRGLLEDEFNAVINNINPTSLQNPDLISAYEILLQSLTYLKLNENEREMLLRILKQKKQNAIFGCLNSFGSIFVPGATPITMLSSLLYTGVSAAFNYKKAGKDAELENAEKTFDIDQGDLEYIDSLRSDLFISTAKVFANKTNCAQGL
ncbi:MAG: zinc-ribbon domain-containing protein, partial [Treponema sp.]|nr:zinc-ribbon domain-containing protein [Treponema sp.]